MINITNIGGGQLVKNLRAATLDRIRTGPIIAAQAMATAMPVEEAERIFAKLKARSERLNREHRAEMRRRSSGDTFEPMPRVDPTTHDYASVFVQAQFGPLDKQERHERQREVGEAMAFSRTYGLPIVILGGR